MLIAGAVEAAFYFGLLDPLNRNAGAIQAVTTVLLVTVTGWYVYLTYHMLQEAKRSQRPYVYLKMRLDGALLEFGIGNSGDRAAEQVEFTVVRDLVDRDGQPVSQDSPLSRGIRYLPPGETYRFAVLAPQDLVGRPPGDAVFDVAVKYRSGGATYVDRFAVDFADFEGVLENSLWTPEEQIAKSLDQIARLTLRREADDQTRRLLAMNRGMKGCPVCVEPISVNATKCPKCLEWLPDEPLAEKPGASPQDTG